MSELVNVSKHGTVAVLTIDNPPVNALGARVRTELVEHVTAAIEDSEVSVIVIAGANGLFTGGADIREFGKPVPDAPSLPEVITVIEDSRKPVVAAIEGVCLGGGLELALGCHYRLATRTARVGLPEVTLGIVPGAGGTQRLPRLIGALPALEVITSGVPLPAMKAHELGIVDAIVSNVETAVGQAAELGPPRRTRELRADGDLDAIDEFRGGLHRRARGAEAPFACVDCVKAAVELPFDQGIAKERELFIRCVNSDQSKALRHAFFAEREAQKIPDVPKDTPTQPVERAAVLGCGTMGGGIAMSFANAKIPVLVLESDRAALDRGLTTIENNYAATVKKGRLSQAEMDERMASITGTLDYEELADADVVVEAVFEEMDLKRQVFERLDAVCKSGAILATNTSTLDVDEIAAATSRPESVIGTHFFSPAHVMRLMENVRAAKTSARTIATVMKLSKRLGKVGVLVGVCDGFVANRMLYAYLRQAHFLLEEGALPQQVDGVITGFGFPMGPFAMSDLAGLDVGWRIRKRRAATRPKHLRYSSIADRICELGRFGQKTGAGWYRYEQGNRTPIPDPEIESLIAGVSAELGIERRPIGDDEILARCMYPLVNEGAKILDDGLALRASDIDVIWMYGFGFPRYRGGPMYWADSIGLDVIYAEMSRLFELHGEWLTPAPLLERLAKAGESFGN